ncbi:MAG: hypothetical protein FWF59_02280, partial [Turicibacter sp.]|nr:hypothetical protein [Turicibacter sp.]
NVMTAGTMNGARIQAGTITADRLAAGAITAGMITAGTMSASRITGGTMVASNLNIHPAGGSTNNAILIQASNHRLVGRQSQGGGSQVRDSFILTNTELRFNDWNNLATATFNPDGFRMHRRMLSGAATNEQCFSLTTHRRSAGDWNTWMTAGSGTGTASAGEHRVQFRNTNRVVVAEFGQEWQSFSVQGYLNVWRNANNVGGTVWSYGFHQHSTQEMKADIEAVPAGTVGTGLSLIEQVKVSEFSYLYHPEEGRVTARNRSSCLKSSERVLGAIAEENASIQSPGEQNLGVDLTKVLWNCVLAIQELSQQNECLRMQVKALSQT